MASDEYIRRAIQTNRRYDDLPPRVRSILSITEWKSKVKDYCIQKGLSWDESMANSVCSEQEYYEDLLKAYRHWHRLFPYHLADYVCRVLRVTPFRHYCDVLASVMKEEKSYDRIPNFTAADIVRLLGIGRNEYIQNMNACKAKKLMWRVNKGIVREYLPTEPLDVRMDPWWVVAVVNLGEVEYRDLTIDEKAILKTADLPGGARVADLDAGLLKALHKKGLIYFHVPVKDTDRFSIPPLEGFVSNKTSEQGDAAVDPVEAVMYAVFVANSERMNVAELATILNMGLPQLQSALSLACRLGFATRLQDDKSNSGRKGGDDMLGLDEEGGGAAERLEEAILAGTGSGEERQGHAVAVVLDAEATSYLMMGALSPGLKRHSVTLFEGGRVAGDEVIKELIGELWVSYEAGQGFEGDMKKLKDYAAALATTLECVKAASGGRPIELLRKESLGGLSPAAACRVLSHAYCAVVPITPMPAPPLPLTPERPGPAYFGPTAEAVSPWLQLALYTTAQCGPVSVVFVSGQRVWRLPSHLDGCTHAILWPWDADPKMQAEAGVPNLVEAQFLLYTLNEMLARTAVMVQPFTCPPIDDGREVMEVVDVPLPLPRGNDFGTTLLGIEHGTGTEVAITVASTVQHAAWELGLASGMGFLRMMRMRTVAGEAAGGDGWVPLSIQLGVPLYSLPLCRAVCQRAADEGFLSPEGRSAQNSGQRTLVGHLVEYVEQYAACTNCIRIASVESPSYFVDLPINNLLFDGNKAQVLDLGYCLQGMGSLIYS